MILLVNCNISYYIILYYIINKNTTYIYIGSSGNEGVGVLARLFTIRSNHYDIITRSSWTYYAIKKQLISPGSLSIVISK